MMNSLDKQYLGLLEKIVDSGNKKGDRTGTGTISVFAHLIEHDMADGFPLLTTKKMAWKQIVSELLWLLSGNTNIRPMLKQGNYIWVGDALKKYKGWEKSYNAEKHEEGGPMFTISPLSKSEFINKVIADDDFATKWGELGPIYGKQWRNWGTESVNGVDQITQLISTLKSNPDSRRIMVNAWNVSEIDSMTLPPCHYGFQVYTRELSLSDRINLMSNTSVLEGENEDEQHVELNQMGVPKRGISLMWNQRSVDNPLGLPFNIASYGILLQLLGELVNMVPEKLAGALGDVHIYRNQLDGVKTQLKRTGHPLCRLSINTEFWLTESGVCGEGELSSDFDALLSSMSLDNFELIDYKYDDKIDYPLSN